MVRTEGTGFAVTIGSFDYKGGDLKSDRRKGLDRYFCSKRKMGVHYQRETQS